MTWLVNGAVLDVHSGELERKHVHVEGDRITDVTTTLPRALSEPVVELDRAFLLPGFFDSHVHISCDSYNADVPVGWANALPGTIALFAARAAQRMLACGITTARDVGGWDYHEIAVREAIRHGWIQGPRLFCAGKILSITSGTTAYYPGMYAVADGVNAVRTAARAQLARGAQFIKVLATGAVTSTEYESPLATQYQREEIEAAVRVAADNRTYVAAHAHSPDGIRNAVEAGCRSIEHTVYGTEEVYRLMAERDVYLVPTLCVSQAMLSDPQFAAGAPLHLRERYGEMRVRHAQNIRLARKLGVRIAMGSDAGTPGNHAGDNMQELEVMVKEAGFTHLEAVQAGTIGAAKMMQVDSQLGAIESGKLADLIAVSRNPLEDISSLRTVGFVMKGGQIIKNELAGQLNHGHR